MDPLSQARMVLLCDSCKICPLQNHCELCRVSLCVNCVGKHLSDSSQKHNVVPYKQRCLNPKYPSCSKHAEKNCEIYCEKCDIPVCSTCITSGYHEGHHFTDILETNNSKLENIEKDLEELKSRLYPLYEKTVCDLQNEKAELEANYGKLMTAADKQGESLHREITVIINQRKNDKQTPGCSRRKYK
jgi:hypothetical protein